MSTARHIIAIGCSAGGFDSLLRIFPLLTPKFAFSIAIVLHRPKTAETSFADVLNNRAGIEVKEAEDKLPIKPGTIYLAPADYHLLVEDNETFALSVDEPVMYSRPSIDVFFESVARAYRERATGILLSGSNADGARGLQSISLNGGITIVQDPKTTPYSEMPSSALKRFQPSAVLDINLIIKLFSEWNRTGVMNETFKSFIS